MQAPQMSPYTGTMITTELIQKYLDENKQLILAILDNQNLGKLHECAAYQSKLQQNLMYLAAIADAQPQAPIPTTQMPGAMQGMSGSMMQANAAQYMQQQQQQQQQHQMAASPALIAQQQQQQQQPGAMHYLQNPLVHQSHQVQHQQHQQQRPLGMQMPSHGDLDLSGNVSSMGYTDYGAAAPAAGGHGGNAGAASAADARSAPSGLENGSNQAAGGAGGAGGTPAAAAPAGAPGDGNVGINGDDAGASFLKASEED